MKNIRLPLVIAFFSSNSSTVINLLVSIILARLLSPAEIGIFSIASVFVSIAHVFRDFGVTSYLKRERELTPKKIRAAMGILITTSWTIGAVIFLFSDLTAEYYRRPEIKQVVQVLALGFVFIPFGAIPMALLARELRAKEGAIASIFGVIAYASSAVTFAYFGFSYMTMAWANLVNIIVTASAFSFFRPQNTPWLPSFRGWGSIIHFGVGAIFTNMEKAINSAIPDVMLGKLSGPHDVGIMSRATSTVNIFSQITGHTVGYATLQFLAQKHHAGESLEHPLSKAISYLTVCAWPALIATGIFAHAIIQFLYGEKWLDSVPIVQIACATAALLVPLTFQSSALMATGRSYLAALPGFTLILLTIPMVMVIYDGSLATFAYALLAANVLNYPVHLWLQHRYLGFHFSKFMQVQSNSLKICLVLAPAMLGLSNLLGNMASWAQLSIVFIITFPLWIYLVLRFDHPIKEELHQLTNRYPLLSTLFGMASKKSC